MKQKDGQSSDVKQTSLYEYGDGIYALSLEERVENRLKEFKKNHKIIDIDYKWIPQKYLGLNCLGMEVFKPRECYLNILYEDY